MRPLRTLLLIEDVKTIQLYIKKLLIPFGYNVDIKTNLEKVKDCIEIDDTIDIALVSMDLYSENLEEIIDVLLEANIPTMLLSGSESSSVKKAFLSKPIIDYIDKDTLSNLRQLTKILRRLDINVNETVLVVDDSFLYRRLITSNLKRHKFNIIQAKDGLEALKTLEENKNINLIITDYEMPNMDGLELIRNVRQQYSIEELPIIVISSLDSSTTVVDCLKSGANDYLHKPFSNHELSSRVYLTLSHKESLDIAKEQKKVYATLFHKSSNGILLMKNGSFIDCNKAALELLKLDTKEQLIGKKPYDFAPKEQPEVEKKETLKKNIKQNQTSRFEYQFLQSDGTPIWIDVLQTPITIQSEEVFHVVWHDITHMKKLENELETLNRSLERRIQEELAKNALQSAHMLEQSRLAQMGEMISMIAHQWRQPLASISAISSTLNLDVLMENYDSAFFQERLESIDELSQHLSLTIDDFRGFFKENKISEETSANHIVESTLQIISSTLETKDINVQLNIKSDKTIYTYINEVRQVLLNLIKNAEDALIDTDTNKKQIVINAYDNNAEICIAVEDNAGGIKEDIIKKVFDPYFSTKKEKDGTGLGLYMSKTIIEDHCKGKLTVENTDKGAKFIITLPSMSQGEST